jgi:hypothetical protein
MGFYRKRGMGVVGVFLRQIYVKWVKHIMYNIKMEKFDFVCGIGYGPHLMPV